MCSRPKEPLINSIPGVKARFFGRVPNVDVLVERQEAMTRLAPHHKRLMEGEGLGAFPLVTAEQVHGNRIAVITPSDRIDGSHAAPSSPSAPIAGVDGLMTDQRGVTLGIFVADCAPVWMIARDGSAGALLHSGKKGTELGIVPQGISMLCKLTGLRPEHLIVAIGPCIRACCYEVDFAGQIRVQASNQGVTAIHDDLICTACHPNLYYSYRREKGLTGRMLATLTLLPVT